MEHRAPKHEPGHIKRQEAVSSLNSDRIKKYLKLLNQKSHRNFDYDNFKSKQEAVSSLNSGRINIITPSYP